jgi:hypothetical protein
VTSMALSALPSQVTERLAAGPVSGGAGPRAMPWA